MKIEISIRVRFDFDPLLVPEAWVTSYRLETTRIGNMEGFPESDIGLQSDVGGEYFLFVIREEVFYSFIIILYLYLFTLLLCYPNL